MRVTVVCFGALRDFLPSGSESNEVVVEVNDDARVRDVAQSFGAPPHLIFAALIGDRRAASDDRVHEGARVTLMPPFTGGRGED